MSSIPRGKHMGKLVVGPPAEDEAEHFIQCEECGGWIDMRDLSQFVDHQGPPPHPPQDRPQ
jgi:hypothetical protein